MATIHHQPASIFINQAMGIWDIGSWGINHQNFRDWDSWWIQVNLNVLPMISPFKMVESPLYPHIHWLKCPWKISIRLVEIPTSKPCDPPFFEKCPIKNIHQFSFKSFSKPCDPPFLDGFIHSLQWLVITNYNSIVYSIYDPYIVDS